uniref:Leucyl-tRNA--protein transferase n=1 Tax=Gracilinema caldarium TaxID=215591 RepID=A0A7C3ILN6_9SPIR
MNYDQVVNALIRHNYQEEFCLSQSFDTEFIRALMEAGFLVMSYADENDAILMPKLHLERSVLFFNNLHISKSAKRLLARYTLKPFDMVPQIIKTCVTAHGDDWLTEPLQEAFGKLAWPSAVDADRNRWMAADNVLPPPSRTFCSAFGLYRDNTLVAGEFGVVSGGVYTSYSGFFTENGAGTVQMILTAQYLEKQGFAFWDLGMPLEYKSALGAVELDRRTFIQKFRESRAFQPVLPVSRS